MLRLKGSTFDVLRDYGLDYKLNVCEVSANEKTRNKRNAQNANVGSVAILYDRLEEALIRLVCVVIGLSAGFCEKTAVNRVLLLVTIKTFQKLISN